MTVPIRCFPGDFRRRGYSKAIPRHSYTHGTARLCELSCEHCRLHVFDPPAIGTAVFVKIYAWPHFFQVRGTVRHSDSEFGVAIEFGEIEAQYISVLNACLLEIEKR
jgi:hypothetical protein